MTPGPTSQISSTQGQRTMDLEIWRDGQVHRGVGHGCLNGLPHRGLRLNNEFHRGHHNVRYEAGTDSDVSRTVQRCFDA